MYVTLTDVTGSEVLVNLDQVCYMRQYANFVEIRVTGGQKLEVNEDLTFIKKLQSAKR